MIGKIPLNGDFYRLRYLGVEDHEVEERLKSWEVTSTLVPDARGLGNSTLVAANVFLIPILRREFDCEPISDDFLETWGQDYQMKTRQDSLSLQSRL